MSIATSDRAAEAADDLLRAVRSGRSSRELDWLVFDLVDRAPHAAILRLRRSTAIPAGERGEWRGFGRWDFSGPSFDIDPTGRELRFLGDEPARAVVAGRFTARSNHPSRTSVAPARNGSIITPSTLIVLSVADRRRSARFVAGPFDLEPGDALELRATGPAGEGFRVSRVEATVLAFRV